MCVCVCVCETSTNKQRHDPVVTTQDHHHPHAQADKQQSTTWKGGGKHLNGELVHGKPLGGPLREFDILDEQGREGKRHRQRDAALNQIILPKVVHHLVSVIEAERPAVRQKRRREHAVPDLRVVELPLGRVSG